MKEYLNPIPNGGAPFNNNRIITELNGEIHAAYVAYLAAFDSHTEGVILSGMQVTGSGPYNVSAGLVYLNGKIRRFPAQVGITLPKYVVPADITTQKVFADGVSRNLLQDYSSTVQNIAPGSGQYIALASATDFDDRRINMIPHNNGYWKQELIYPFPSAWNMDTTDSFTIPHNLGTDVNRVCAAFCPIPGATGIPTFLTSADGGDAFGSCHGNINFNSTNIVLARKIGGIFDSATYNAVTSLVVLQLWRPIV